VVAVESELGEAAARRLLEGLVAYQAVLAGPGLGGAEAFIGSFLEGYPAGGPALVLDADALNGLSRMGEWWRLLPERTVLTPHPGEMARLTGLAPAELKERERIELARHYAAAWGCVLLLKGAYTVIAGAGDACTVLPFANPILGVAGSGDVLGGVIAGLLAQGMAPFEGAVLGGYLHGAAGGLAAEAAGDSGVLAGELADWVPRARLRLIHS
jgi:NAD(P)H-hydrate epimerase